VVLSLEQYASLCVELAVEPAKTYDTLRRYGITFEHWKELDHHWNGRLAAEPGVEMTFRRAYTAYEAWFIASRGR
jgi:hypothetical protein